MAEDDPQTTSLLELTADIASAYVERNHLPAGDLPALIKSIHAALAGVDGAVEEPAKPLEPAVSVRKSITPDYLICLEDGRRFKSLKRHLRTKYGLSPEAYRAKWSLPKTYPMVAPAYAAARSKVARQMGLGVGGRAARANAAAAKPARKASARKA